MAREDLAPRVGERANVTRWKALYSGQTISTAVGGGLNFQTQTTTTYANITSGFTTATFQKNCVDSALFIEVFFSCYSSAVASIVDIGVGGYPVGSFTTLFSFYFNNINEFRYMSGCGLVGAGAAINNYTLSIAWRRQAGSPAATLSTDPNAILSWSVREVL